jgi:hypothetical protein
MINVYEEFQDWVEKNCMYETIYDDSDGRQIMIIKMLDAYGMVNKAPKKEWVGLTDKEVVMLAYQSQENECTAIRLAEAKLKEKNNGNG